MAPVSYKQDMPPSEGYSPITWERIAAKKYFSGYSMFAIFGACTAIGYYFYYHTRRRINRENIEMNDARVALEPLLFAERERLLLKQLRKNLEEEKELMKNVPGWVPGTLYGEPIYKTTGNKWVDPSLEEYYGHTSFRNLDKMVNLKLTQ